MSKIGLWHIQSDRPVKLRETTLDLESRLEAWIEQDPTLVQSGLVVVGRQIIFDNGRLDLLALDPNGRWVVIEIKAGAVRSETVGQALYYAAKIDAMPEKELHERVDAYLKPQGKRLAALLKERGIEPGDDGDARDVVVMLVGTRRAAGLDEVVNYLAGNDFPISIITFDVHQTASGERILTREITEQEPTPLPTPTTKRKLIARSIDELVQMADKYGAGGMFRQIWDAAARHGLHPRNYASSVMYTSPRGRTRMLFTIWTRKLKQGMLSTYIGHSAFAEFYPVTEEEVAECLGPEGWRWMTQADVDVFIAGLDRLFEKINTG